MSDNVGEFRGIRIGAIAFFGIMVPGVWFWATMLFPLWFIFQGHGLNLALIRLNGLALFPHPYWLMLIQLLVFYITGAVLRILPPDMPDQLSLRWVRRRESDERIEPPDRFPYESLPKYLRYRKLGLLAQLLPWDETQQPKAPRSKTFVHFIKLHIAKEEPGVASHLAAQEAFIRLMSGVFYAILASSPAYFIFAAVAILQSKFDNLAMITIGICVFNTMILIGILYAFHYQRLREMVMILSAYFLVTKPAQSPYTVDTKTIDDA